MSSTLLDSVKDRKLNIWAEFSLYEWNHPSFLQGIAVSGLLSYTIDERSFTSPGLSASKYEYDLDFSDADDYSRVYESNVPWTVFPPPRGILNDGEFLMSHQPSFPWGVIFYDEDNQDTKIGTCTKTDYSRDEGTDPWTEDGSTTTDIDFHFDVSPFGGGEPDSGGKGDGSDDEKVDVSFFPDFSGSHNSKLPNFELSLGEVLRLPWAASWASETAAFSAIFSDHLSDGNTSDGGGHSGTCSLSLDFT